MTAEYSALVTRHVLRVDGWPDTLNKPIVCMASTTDGVAIGRLLPSDGGIFGSVDKSHLFEGSMGGQPLNVPDRGWTAPFLGAYQERIITAHRVRWNAVATPIKPLPWG